LCDRENVPDIIKDIDVAAAIGAEMYVIDAGWYGNEPNRWWLNTGDWFEGAWMAAGGGLRAVADHAHARGMKFGLWVEIEAAGANSTLKREHPDWLLQRDGKPVGSGGAAGRALDLTNPEVAAFVEGEITRLIRTYDLDMYRLDHNHTIQPSGNRQYAGFTEDLTWRYYESFGAIFDHLRAEFPHVVFQNCAGGGGRLDWGTLSRFHNTELSDWMRMPRGLKILNGVTMSLPPEILLRTFGTEVPNHVHEGDVDTQLRLCFSRIIFRGIAPSVEELTPYLAERIGHYLQVYKEVIRPIWLDGGRVYHHTPFLRHDEPTPWCVLEYAKPDRTASVAAIFRTNSARDDPEYIFRPRGLNPGAQYRVMLDNTGLSYQASGAELVRQGVPVRLEVAQTSELVVFKAL
jgi:alpha-galactosidase